MFSFDLNESPLDLLLRGRYIYNLMYVCPVVYSQEGNDFYFFRNVNYMFIEKCIYCKCMHIYHFHAQCQTNGKTMEIYTCNNVRLK